MSRKADVDPGALVELLARVFGSAEPLTFHRTPDGVSTQVYRIVRGAETFYLRVAEEPGDNLETDAEVHRRLIAAGAHVPGVVDVDPFNAAIGRSVMVTTAIAGVSLADGGSAADAVSVIEAAGADLALINEMAVDGFGWVRRRGAGWPLTAVNPTYQAYLVSDLPHPWPGPLAALFSPADLDVVEGLLERAAARPPARAQLAHGDFDVTPIFCDRDRYTGLIDFGEIRGTEPLFDLAHFHLHDGETRTVTLLPALLRGYDRVSPLPADHLASIRVGAVLLGLRQLCRWLGPPRHRTISHPAVIARAQRITDLLAQH